MTSTPMNSGTLIRTVPAISPPAAEAWRTKQIRRHGHGAGGASRSSSAVSVGVSPLEERVKEDRAEPPSPAPPMRARTVGVREAQSARRAGQAALLDHGEEDALVVPFHSPLAHKIMTSRCRNVWQFSFMRIRLILVPSQSCQGAGFMSTDRKSTGSGRHRRRRRRHRRRAAAPRLDGTRHGPQAQFSQWADRMDHRRPTSNRADVVDAARGVSVHRPRGQSARLPELGQARPANDRQHDCRRPRSRWGSYRATRHDLQFSTPPPRRSSARTVRSARRA